MYLNLKMMDMYFKISNNDMMNTPNNTSNNDSYIFDDIMSNDENNYSKTIRLYYEKEYIQNVDLYPNDDISSIKKKIKSILYKNGKKNYRPAFDEDILERTSPNETLELLIERGVLEKDPIIYILYISKGFSFPLSKFNFAEINDGDIFKVQFGGNVNGGRIGGIDFVNVDNLTKSRQLYFSNKAPDWRKVSIGLNLFGECTNKICQAYKFEVVHIVGINKKFDFSTDKKSIKCPICSKNFLPNTMGFWKCEYQIKGEKFKDGNYEEIDINGKETKGDNFEYYDPYQNETAYWSSLTIFTGHRQKMKYRRYTF